MVRTISQYIALTFLLAVLGVEIAGGSFGSPALEIAYDYLLAIVFSLFTIAMIAMCGWIVFLWDIDRLFFRLEGRIDAQINAENASDAQMHRLWTALERCLRAKCKMCAHEPYM
jgi:hypothetical protein